MTSILKKLMSYTTSADGAVDDALFKPVQVGRFKLDNRFVYGPLSRCRGLGQVPQPAAVTYYSQRAAANTLMLTEATPVTQQGQGLPSVPGIYTQQQIEAWKPIVNAVHDKGVIFFQQLWHVGRASHYDYQPNGEAPVGPSAVAITSEQVFAIKQGRMTAFPVPRALKIPEIHALSQLFAQGAKNSLEAGFDGVEIHSGNGYLLDQFLSSSANKRTDKYGGSIENRCRFIIETVEAVIEAVGSSDRVGIRFTPFSHFNDAYEETTEDVVALLVYLLEQLNKYNLAYVHILSARASGNNDIENPDLVAQSLAPFRKAYKGKIIAAGGYNKESAEAELRGGNADLICFGRWWLANPDLMERFKTNKPLNKYDRATFYTQDQVVGYTDYPFLKDIPEDTPIEMHYTGVTVYSPKETAVATQTQENSYHTS